MLLVPVHAPKNAPQIRIQTVWLLAHFVAATLGLVQFTCLKPTILPVLPVLLGRIDLLQIQINFAHLVWLDITIIDTCRLLATRVLLERAQFWKGAPANLPVSVTGATFAGMALATAVNLAL